MSTKDEARVKLAHELDEKANKQPSNLKDAQSQYDKEKRDERETIERIIGAVENELKGSGFRLELDWATFDEWVYKSEPAQGQASVFIKDIAVSISFGAIEGMLATATVNLNWDVRTRGRNGYSATYTYIVVLEKRYGELFPKYVMLDDEFYAIQQAVELSKHFNTLG